MANKESAQNPKAKTAKPKKLTAQSVMESSTTPIYLVGAAYLVVMAFICYFILYLRNSKYTNLVSNIMFMLYFVVLFVFAYKKGNTPLNSILIPLKLLCSIMGIAFVISFVSTQITTLYNNNIQYQNTIDIGRYSELIYENNKLKVYADIANNKLFTIDESDSENKIGEYELYIETAFDYETLEKTNVFYDLTDNIRFSYVLNDTTNHFVLQYTKDKQRYLSYVSAEKFVNILIQNDGYKTTLFDNGNIKIYQEFNPNLILISTKDTVTLSEFDTITDIKGFTYLDRVYTYLTNHFEEEIISNQNSSAELVVEYLNDKIRFNLYTIACASCTYRYDRTDIGEIVIDNIAYIFNLDIPADELRGGN